MDKQWTSSVSPENYQICLFKLSGYHQLQNALELRRQAELGSNRGRLKATSDTMAESGESRSLMLQWPERDSNLSSTSSAMEETAIEGTVKQQQSAGFSNFDTSLRHMEDEASFQQNIPALIVRPPMPTNSGFFTDLLLGTAALTPNASVSLTSQTTLTA